MLICSKLAFKRHGSKPLTRPSPRSCVDAARRVVGERGERGFQRVVLPYLTSRCVHALALQAAGGREIAHCREKADHGKTAVWSQRLHDPAICPDYGRIALWFTTIG